MRQLPITFGQRDFLQALGTSPVQTIASSGCYVTSFADLARYYGKQTDPVDLNTQLINAGLYVQDDLIGGDDTLQKVYPDIVYQGSILFPNEVKDGAGNIVSPAVPADLGKLKELLTDPSISVILEIDLGGGFTHFSPCVGVNGVVSLADTETKSVIDFASKYGDPAQKIIKFVVYKGTPATADQGVVDQLRFDRDKNWNLYQDQVKVTEGLQEQLKVEQDKIVGVQNQNNELKDKIAAVKIEVEDVTNQNTSLSDLYSKEAAKNSQTIRDGREALNNLTSIHNFITSIAAHFKKPVTTDDPKKMVQELVTMITEDGEQQVAQIKAQVVTQAIQHALPTIARPNNMVRLLQFIGVLEK